MAIVLHLLKGASSGLAEETIGRQVGAGDQVTVALLQGGPRPPLPDGVPFHRVPDDLSYSALLDLIFAADQVIAW